MIFDYGKYVVFNGLLQLIIYTKEKNAILFTYPPAVSSLFEMDNGEICYTVCFVTLNSLCYI